MAYKHLFVDSDILLDLLLNREPFSDFSETLINLRNFGLVSLNTSVLVIANINYIHSRQTNSSTTKESLKRLTKLINILPFESDIIIMALNSPFTDFEDAIQNFIAERYKCEVILTRNIKDYKQATLPVLTAEQFLRTL